jgi:hypothetical protein
MPHRAVHVCDDAGAARGIPDGMRDMPHDKRWMAALDVQPLGGDAAFPAGQQTFIGGLRQMPSDCHELYTGLLPEQRMS